MEEGYFWVEEGQGSLGDLPTAKKFIDAAYETGANGIEFQLAIPDEFYVDTHPYFEHYKKIQFSNKQIIELINYTKSKGIDFIATVLSSSLVDVLASNGCSSFVINASDINNPEIIDSVSKSGLPFYISLPLANETEIEWAVKRCFSNGAGDFILMHGQHTMASGENGVSLNDSNLGFINTLKTRYGLPVGYIDHSNTIYMPAVARSSGANFISKHLSLDKTQKGPDWFICLEPDDMKNSIQIFRDTCFSLSNSSKLITDSEAKDKKYMRRSIVAASDIEQGSVINRNMLAFKRPYGGIEPKNYSNLLGKTSKKPIKRNELISMEDLL